MVKLKIKFMKIKNILILLIGFNFFSCSNSSDDLEKKSSKKIVTIKGSDTVLPIVEAEVSIFKTAFENISLSIAGGGTGDGIKALINGETDIAMASRDLKDEEKLELKNKNKIIIKKIIAYDALMIIVNPNNSISKLTREQIELIYTGKITNWSEVGGQNLTIEIYTRETTSGTNSYFKEQVLDDKEYSNNILSTFVNEAIVQSVEISKGAIGYIGLGFKSPKIKALSVSFDQGKTYVYPSLSSIMNKSYPISRPLFFMYENTNVEKAKEISDFTLSDEGQKIIKELGYIPL